MCSQRVVSSRIAECVNAFLQCARACKVRRGRLMAYVSKPIVLVVEDDAMQRLLAVTVVEDAGFEAIEADNADEAIDILESQNEIRIVFTDIEMPGSMDGMKLAAVVRDRWPPVQIIVTPDIWPRRTSRFLLDLYSWQSHTAPKQ
jgi:CheY-like chemotaxis protein